MRHGFFWTLVLLGVPQVAAADGVIGAAVPPILPGGAPAIERAGTPATTAPPGLDLRIDRSQLPPSQHRPYDAPAIETGWADRERDAADHGLSFGLEMKNRSRIGPLAREDGAKDSGFDDQLEKLIERPVFGLRGRYRF